jgi:WD40 repeat protein
VLDDRAADVFAEFAPDGSWLWTVDRQHGLRVWDAATGRPYPAWHPPGGRDRTSAHWMATVSPDSRWIAAAFDRPEPAVLVWEATTGRTVAALDGACHPVVFTPDSRGLVTATPGTDVKIWDVTAGRVRATLPGHASRVGAVAVSPDGRLVAAGLHRGETNEPARLAPTAVKLWDRRTGAEVAAIDVTEQPQNGMYLDFSPDGRLLVIHSSAGRGLVWDVTATPPRNRDDLIASTEHTFLGRPCLDSGSLWFSPDGAWWLVRGGGQTRHTLLEPAAGPPPPTFRPHPHGLGTLSSKEFSPDGRTVAVIDTYDGPVYRDDLRGWVDRILRRPVPHRTRTQVSLNAVAAGRTLVTLPSTGDSLQLLGYSPDGRTFWTADLVSPPKWGGEGIRVFRGWAVPTGRPSVWLVAATALAVLAVAADVRRSRRGRGA